MTYEDDFARLNLSVGTFNIPLEKMGLTWPPPPRLYVANAGIREALDEDDPAYIMIRISVSEITDEDRKGMTHVARGAEYFYVDESKVKEEQ